MQKVTKMNGQVVEYDERKVRDSLTRIGLHEDVIKSVLTNVKKKLTPKIRTSELFKIVDETLKEKAPWAAARYNLRAAITKLGPAGFHFEKYVASILAAYGYKTETPDTYQGACIKHEIDVTAEKDGRRVFIEAKFRHDFSSAINIKDTMATWTRFLDLVDGSKLDLCPHFDEVWIVTNARFTDQSMKFGHCKNMKLVGWNHPEERTFAQMVDLDALYPITIIPSLSENELESFAESNIMLCRDLSKLDTEQLKNVSGLNEQRSSEILEECRMIVEGES